MKTAYIFDVDGTLTPSRSEITPEFREMFTHFCLNQDVYIVSGSDYAKTVEQLGTEITDELVKCVYNCSGNSIWERGIEIYASEWRLPAIPTMFLEDILTDAEWDNKTGFHFDDRPGSINFSILGRNADMDERAEYIVHDTATNERRKLVTEFNERFKDTHNIEAQVGGETGIDITEYKSDKRQILRDFEDRDVWFIGDRMEQGGNDHSLKQAILARHNEHDQCISVESWEDTATIIKSIEA